MSKLALTLCLAGICAGWASVAHADRTDVGKIAVGFCVPEIPFSGALARHHIAKRVAQHLSRSLRRPVEGLAYINPRDLRRDIRTGVLHFAVVGALFAATVPEDQILAQGQQASAAGVWSILTRSKRGLEELKGKRLQIPKMGPGTLTFVRDGVLRGEVDPRTHFKVQWSPDLLSAQQAILLNQADAVVAPVSGKNLAPALRGYAIPPPAFVLVDRQVPKETIEMARKAIFSFRVSIGTVQGWHKPDAGVYRKLAAFAGRQELRMVLVPDVGIPLDVADLIQKEVLLPRMPELDEPGVR